jgi:hypothetical protein
VFSMALSRARPIKNSKDRSVMMLSSAPNSPGLLALTVYTFRVHKCLVLLRLVPGDNQAVTEGQGCARVCRTVLMISCVLWCATFAPLSYASSQLNSDRASVVSMCCTVSAWNSSLVENSFLDCESVSSGAKGDGMTPSHYSQTSSTYCKSIVSDVVL